MKNRALQSSAHAPALTGGPHFASRSFPYLPEWPRGSAPQLSLEECKNCASYQMDLKKSPLLGRFDPDMLDRPHNTTVAGQVPTHFLPLGLDWAKTDVRSAFGAYNATVFEHGYCYGVPITVNVDISLN
jgi:hypothetical protein